jgi:gluconolactonase
LFVIIIIVIHPHPPTNTTPLPKITDGIEFSPDYKHVYMTDTGCRTYPGVTNLTDPATIYRFDVTPDGKRLQNRQVFTYSDVGFPDGIHTDVKGNVYAGSSDGIHV